MEFTEWDYGISMSSVFQGQKSTRAFTLIEMIVVIAIIAILIALGLPMYSSFKEKGRRAQCVNNLKQWGTAFYMYAAENNGCLPQEGGGGTTTNGASYWFNVVPTYMNQPSYANYVASVGGFRNAAVANSVFNCPSKRLNRNPSDIIAFYSAYTYNQWIDGSGTTDLGTTVLSRITKPNDTVLIFAAYDYDAVGTWAAAITNNASGTFMRGPQKEGFNVLFAGGNVRFAKNSEVRSGSVNVTNSPTLIWNPNYIEDGW
ncbi:MAG: DUF1559 domain-containing protein [Verrucomicrobiae bacterium]|nr:DUF1559 domain-containing protein [Verrucomicrobiae bacterium]